MKNLILIIAVLFLCTSPFFAQEISGNGNVMTLEKPVDQFSELTIKGVFNVILDQGQKEKVRIEADENLIDNVIIHSYDGHLEVSTKKGFSIKKSKKMNVYITFKDINDLKINGVGNVRCSNHFKLKDLDLEIEGVGNTDLTFDCDNLESEMSTVGNVTLSGSANRAEVDHSGVGNLKASDFKIGNLIVVTSGVGNVHVYAQNEISISSSGIGNFTYSGDANVTHMDVSGIGKVRKE